MSNEISSIKQSISIATLCLITEFSYGLISCQNGIDYKNSCNPYDNNFYKVGDKPNKNNYHISLDDSVKKEIYHSQSYFDSLLEKYRASYDENYGYNSLIDRDSYSSLDLDKINEDVKEVVARIKPKPKPKSVELSKNGKKTEKTQHKSIKYENKSLASKTSNLKTPQKISKTDLTTEKRDSISVSKEKNSIVASTKVALSKDNNKSAEKVVKKDIKNKGYKLYIVKKGDTLIKIAKMFAVKKSSLLKLNYFEDNNTIKIGQKIKIPLNSKLALNKKKENLQKDRIDNIDKNIYIVQKGDTLSLIAKKTNTSITLLREINRLSRSGHIRVGQKIRLTVPKIAKLELKTFSFTKDIKFKKVSAIKFKRKIKVIATAYTSHKRQTDNTPYLAAWNNRLKPGMKIIAVSPDLIKKYGLTNGVKVKIMGLSGYYVVRDKMNKRWKNRIDIYMGTNKKKALEWGRRKIVLYW